MDALAPASNAIHGPSLRQRLAARGFDAVTLLVIPAALFSLLLFVYPFAFGFILSFEPKAGGDWLANYRRFFADSFLYETIAKTLWLSVPTTLINLFLAVPIAFRVRLMRNQRKSMRRAAYQWRRSNEEAQAIVARLPRHAWTHVRYEDLCTAPEATLEAAWRFVGVAPRPPENDIQHVLGHSSRLEAQRREIALDEKWRVDLSAEDLRVFDEVAGRMNRRLGYGA